ncbi:unnamed protein product, partial [Polarella glacialis]
MSQVRGESIFDKDEDLYDMQSFHFPQRTAKLAPDADLYEVAQKLGIEFFIVCFVDVFGVLRSKMVPAEAIKFIQKEGAGFAPMATWHDYGPECADMTAIPDASTLIQVPFQKDLGFVIGDLYIEGQKVQ